MSLDLAGIFAAGLLTFASPCILPLVPLYLGLLGGASAADLRRGAPPRLLARTAAFAAGLTAVFVALGLVSSAAGELLSAHRRTLLTLSGVVVVAFGLRFLGVLRLPLVDRERRPWLNRFGQGGSLAAAFAFGGAFALGWTPCIGPVLGSVLTYTASAGASAARGALYLGVYAAGLALPLLATAAFAPFALRLLDRLKPHLRKLEVATGLLLVAAGALMASDRLMLLMPSLGPGPEPSARVAAAATPASPAHAPPVVAGAAEAGEGVMCEAPGGTGSTCATPELGQAQGAPLLVPEAAIHGPAVVELMSRTCVICRAMAPVVAEAERGCPMKVVRTLVEEPAGAELARRHRVHGVPTFLVLDAHDAEVKRLVGEQPASEVRSALELVSPQLCRAAPPGAGGEPTGS
jgi:cytochrome c-type biogenesis protein